MSVCAFIKADSTRCRAQAMQDSEWCFSHDPTLAEERREARSKGGRTAGRGRPKGGTELAWAKAQLRDVTEGVLEGRIDTRRGAVVAQLLTAFRGTVEAELKALEYEEVEERLAELEARAQAQPRWGSRYN